MLTESASIPISATAIAPQESANPRRRPSPLSLAAWKQFVDVAKPYWLGQPVLLIGSSRLCGAYARALAITGCRAETLAALDCTVAGLSTLRPGVPA